MITFFTSPRSFRDAHTATIQRNAIQSWLSLKPRPQVLLMGTEAGVAEVAHEYSVQHIPQVKANSDGIPLRSSMCEIARDVAEHRLICIINTDIIILRNFYEGLKFIALERFVAAGRRYDLDIEGEITFDQSWQIRLLTSVRQRGALHGPSAIDYAVYPRAMEPQILPPFAVNALGWDPWFLGQHKRLGIPVVDLTSCVTVVHQNHQTTREIKIKHRQWRTDAVAMRSLAAIGGFENLFTLREADYVVGESGLRYPRLVGRALSRAAHGRVYRRLMGAKRRIQRLAAYVFLGLENSTLPNLVRSVLSRRGPRAN